MEMVLPSGIFEECEPFYINLDKGVNLVRFTANKNNPNYDYILFRRVGDQEELYNKVIKAEGANKIEQKNTMQPVRQATTQYAPKTLQKMITQGLAWLI